VPKVNKSALLEYSAVQMFNLVNDIESYPTFLPWCSAARILKRDDSQVEASISISHSGVNKTFATRNVLKPFESIELNLLDGPFKSLQGIWRFHALQDNACKVSLELDYEFSSKLLGLVVGPVFNQIANSLVDAFCDRARSVYGS